MPEKTRCGTGYEDISDMSSYCYKFVPELKSLEDAEQDCNRYGSLFTFKDQTIFKHIRDRAHKMVYNVWVGYKRGAGKNNYFLLKLE